MPNRDRKRVYEELNGFRMAVEDLNREIALQRDEFPPPRLPQSPRYRRGSNATGTQEPVDENVDARFARDAAVAAANRHSRR